MNNPSHFELSAAFKIRLPLINIKIIFLDRHNKYILGRRNRFLTKQRPEKQELNYESNEIIVEWFTKS